MSFEDQLFPRIPYFRSQPSPSSSSLVVPYLLLIFLSAISSVRTDEDVIMCRGHDLSTIPSCRHSFLCLYCGVFYKCKIFNNFTDKFVEKDEVVEDSTTQTMICSVHVKTIRRQTPLQTNNLTRFRRQTREVVSDQNANTNGYSPQFRWEHPLVVLKILACVTLTLSVSAAIIVFLVCGMFYQDCLAHMCSEMALLQAYICILSVTTDIEQLNMTACSITAVLLHYFFTVVFLCQAMEVYFMCRLLYYQCPRQFLRDPFSLLLIAWGVPAVLTGISSHFLLDSYAVAINNCWLNVRGSAMLVVVIPICVCVGFHIIMLLAVFCVANAPNHKHTTEYFRARACLTTRWASLIILILTCLSWSMGILALNLQYRSFYIVFCIASIFLGSSVLVIRIATERQVRMMIWTRLFPNSGIESVSWPVSSFDTVDDISDDIHLGWKTPAIIFGSQESIQTRY